MAWCPQAKKLTPHSLARWACGSEISPVMKACAPAAMAAAGSNDYADVPIPEWRPDLPPPPGFGAQGDQAAN